MENRKKQIENVNSRYQDLTKRRTALCEVTGRYLWEADSLRTGLESQKELQESMDGIANILRQKEDLQAEIDQLSQILEEKRQTEDARREARNNIRELEKINQSLYENMGRAAYQAYREGLLKSESYGNIFLALEEQREKINTYEVELKKSSEERGTLSFFKSIANRSREMYLKSNQAMKLKNLDKIYQKAGEALGDLAGNNGELPGLKELENNEPLKRSFLPFQKNRERQSVLIREDDALAERERKLLARLEELNLGKNPQKSLQEMDTAMRGLDETLVDQFGRLGEDWRFLDKIKKNDLPLSDSLTKEWEALIKEETDLQKEKKQLDREIAMAELREKIKNQEKEISHQESRIKKCNDELDKEKTELDRMTRELGNLEAQPAENPPEPSVAKKKPKKAVKDQTKK